jgi:predicted nucleic acid-binding protein
VPIVIDASVMVNWHFPDERSAEGEAVLRMLNRQSAYVPAIWWFEIRNVLLLGERRGRSTREQAEQFLAFLRSLPIEVAELPDEAAVMDLARRHRLSFYDAAYLELAQQRSIALATLDQQLARAATAEGVPLIGAA